MLSDSIASRLPLVAGFLGVTAAPSLVASANEVVQVAASVPVESNTTLILQIIIGGVTIISEVFRYFAKKRADKNIINPKI